MFSPNEEARLDRRARRARTAQSSAGAAWGTGGLRDGRLLQSALARVQQQYAEAADIIDMATAYTAGIVHNHPFLDDDKHTGFVVGILFLELNGYRFVASEEDAAQAVLKLADRTLDEADYSSFLRGNVVRKKK